MSFTGKRRKVLLGAGVIAAAAAMTFTSGHRATGSDHAGTTESVQKPGIDFSDLHIFPGSDPANVVFAMSVRPLIPQGQATPANFSFDTDVLYQFKIDTNADTIEDLVLQARFEGKGTNQKVFISGPIKPTRIGTITRFETPLPTSGVINQTFSPTPGMKVFAGLREDPFFLDLNQLFAILPDRGAPLKPELTQPKSEANTPRKTSWRAPGEAQDFFVGFNVLSIVVEMPRTMLKDPTTGRVGKIGVWETTSVAR